MDIERLRKSYKRIIDVNKISAQVSRETLKDNGRGQMIPDGTNETHNIECRISHEGGGVWKYGVWDGGLATNKTKYLIVSWNTDIKENDILICDDESFRIGVVSKLKVVGEVYGQQAELFKAD
ncbi:MAG: hypothetical protein LBQ37_02480 [Elusimicrobiota bacterium]|nr:hypothetical protein [Elusimicrobiota bacterium]